MPDITVTEASLNDINQLQTIGRKTFSETFSASNTAADMDAYLAAGFSTEKLTAELNSADSAVYFARHNGEVIGYLKLNFGQSQTELKSEKALEIERIYVLNAFHGQKVGQLLYEKAIEIAQKLSVDYVWLGVWEHNPRAIAFYKKNGFVPFDTHVFRLGTDKQTDIMMKLILWISLPPKIGLLALQRRSGKFVEPFAYGMIVDFYQQMPGQIEPGDLLFVPAGVDHRFMNFTDDFATRALFYGPDGDGDA